MSNATSVLVPVAALQGEALSEALVEVLSSVEVTLLGYHEIPDQTATEQAHDQFNEQMQRKLDEYVELFAAHGGTVTPRTVFTHDAPETFKRIAIEEDIGAILVTNPAPAIDRVLVPIRGPVNLDPILTMTAALSVDPEIVLFHAAPSDETRADGEELLSTAAAQLEAAGVDPDRIDRQLAVSDTPIRAISDAATDTGLVVIGEKEPSVVDIIFGDAADRIAEAAASPVLVVRTDRSDED
ncbi:universal stress protein [Halohasta litorea]|uniref:Universal stress protein n=1 Tax=Halohasta litorea TaxID=869891 RepID=A0ABD6D6D5_9EURY|nr:universal stress protein [Halohasta litorea]